ncbi:MAG: helical backbone metal receptor [Candidatus Poseidonia sp.]|nr:helical backbone metal receptor [Poseidonia sp.]
MRVVSLVPSLTLTLFDLGLTANEVVGRTAWCIHPSEEIGGVPVMGGTKTPTLSKILHARPDLVVMDRDENPKAVHDWCIENGLTTFVCHVQHPRDVPEMLRELGQAVNRKARAHQFAEALEHHLQLLEHRPPLEMTVAPLIWHDPLMVADAHTYAGGMLSCLGFDVAKIEPEGNGYPAVTPEVLIQHGVDGLLMSSEPYNFSLEEGQALARAMSEDGRTPPWVKCIDGEALTWMGSATMRGLEKLERRLL